MSELMSLPPIREMSAATVARRRAELVALAWVEPVAETTRRPAGHRRRRALGVLAAALLGLALLVVALPVITTRAPVGAPPASAAEQLEKAADALSGSSAAVAPGQYSYLHRRDQVRSMISIDGHRPLAVLVRHDDRYWVAPDGSGRVATLTDDPAFATEEDREAYRLAGEPPVLPVPGRSTQDVGPGGLAVDVLEALPSEPEQALDYIRDGNLGGGRHPSDAVVFDTIGEALTRAYLPVDIRQTLYRAAALIPGVQLVEGFSDQAGRMGTAVALRSDDGWHTLAFDSQTGTFFERAFHPSGDAGGPIGQPETWTTVVESGVVDAPGALP